MILVDTSVWTDHFRVRGPNLSSLLEDRNVLAHLFVIGEIALGQLRQRNLILTEMQDLPEALVATHQEVMHLIERRRLSGLGIGYVDAHLVASGQLTPGSFLWTRDKRLHEDAIRLGSAATHLDRSNGAGP